MTLASRLPHFLSLGCYRRLTLLAGVVYNPFYEELFAAARDILRL